MGCLKPRFATLRSSSCHSCNQYTQRCVMCWQTMRPSQLYGQGVSAQQAGNARRLLQPHTHAHTEREATTEDVRISTPRSYAPTQSSHCATCCVASSAVP
eukprot:scaffold149575_cov26-Tisochrysis_lutea.AAC.1